MGRGPKTTPSYFRQGPALDPVSDGAKGAHRAPCCLRAAPPIDRRCCLFPGNFHRSIQPPQIRWPGRGLRVALTSGQWGHTSLCLLCPNFAQNVTLTCANTIKPAPEIPEPETGWWESNPHGPCVEFHRMGAEYFLLSAYSILATARIIILEFASSAAPGTQRRAGSPEEDPRDPAQRAAHRSEQHRRSPRWHSE